MLLSMIIIVIILASTQVLKVYSRHNAKQLARVISVIKILEVGAILFPLEGSIGAHWGVKLFQVHSWKAEKLRV